jgi:hypothetical protein
MFVAQHPQPQRIGFICFFKMEDETSGLGIEEMHMTFFINLLNEGWINNIHK